MPELVFAPWNADANVNLNGLRLLVVGESHYKERGCSVAFTTDETTKIVKANAPGFAKAQANSFFSKIADSLTCEHIGRDDVWKHIYFCNYFQRPFEEPRERPKASDYAESKQHFDDVLQLIKPEAILVMSSRLWHGMANKATFDPAYDGSKAGLGRCFRFTGGEGLDIPAAHTWHPSAPRGFQVREWKARITHFLKWVKPSDPADHTR